MIKKSFFVLTAAVAMLFASCEKYDRAISDIEDRLDKIEGTSLTTIDQQITAINSSIDDLKDVDDELEGYISTLQTTAADLQSQIDATNTALAALESDLEGQITASEQKVLNELDKVKSALEGELTTINNTIDTLQAKDAELGQKIADLQKYVDDEITATEDWASATFSTLEQYEATQTAISEIKALIKSTQESITALEEKLGKKIADDIAAAVAGVNADIAAKVKEITDAYTEAIATTKTAIEAAYTKAIEDAIKASEAKMENWVNGVLAEGYYKKAEIDGKITALATQVTEGDEALQREIDSLETALAKAESDLTAAYKEAIKKAIEDNNGKITAEIEAAVKTAQDNLQAQIDTINIEIENIKTRLDIIEADINTINQQIAAIKGSIDDLKAMDTELGGYISALQTTADDLQSQIDATNAEIENVKKEIGKEIDAVEQSLLNKLDNLKTTLEGELATIKANIEALKAKDTELEGKITTLETYVNNKLQTTEDWVNATFATLAQYQEVLTTIAGIKSDISAINTAMANLETRINSINEEIDDIKDRLAALEDNVEDLIGRIQSIRFLPEYSDGKVELTSDNAPVTLTFLLSPNEAALAVAAKKNVVTAYLSLTQERTRAVGTPTQINVTKVTGTDDGVLTVEVNTENLPDDYWATAENANLFIRINDGNNDVISEMIPTFYTVICELPSGKQFRKAVHDQLADDTKAIKFIANSNVETDYQIGTSPAYMRLNGTTLEIHTATKEFVFNANCTYMFSGETETGYDKFANLTAIDFNDCINTANVTNMSYMFYYCSALTSLDLSAFNTEKVTNMCSMFNMCSALTSLDLSSFNTEKVTNMAIMFNYCSALTSLNLSKFNTANVTNMRYMFSDCQALESLDIRNFNIENVTYITDIFTNVETNNSSKTAIMVKLELYNALDSKGVTLDDSKAEYIITDAPM